MRDYKIIVEPLAPEDGDGWLAYVPELPGCISDGETPRAGGTMPGIRAHLTKGVGGGHLSDDGRYGLLKFDRERPDSTGSEELWIGVPPLLLPYLAAVALSTHPQPNENGDVPAALSSQAMELGVGSKGEVVLTHELEKGAKLSFLLDRGQADLLLEGLKIVLGKVDPHGGVIKPS